MIKIDSSAKAVMLLSWQSDPWSESGEAAFNIAIFFQKMTAIAVEDKLILVGDH